MSDELVKNIEHHLATFPDRHQEFLELRKEWREFKTRAMWAMVSFIGAILAIGVWVGTMESQHRELEDHAIETTVDVKALEARTNMLEVNNSEIRARLVSIEVTLQEIKAAIIKLQ